MDKHFFTVAARWLALAVSLTFAVCMPAQAQSDSSPSAASDAKPALWTRYPAGTIQSLDVANTVLAEAAAERKQVNARFAESDRACIPKFFANNCRDMAKERRREALAKLKALEVEANLFKRRERVVERDRALEEARVKEATAAVGVSRSRPEKTAKPASKTSSENAPAATPERTAADASTNLPSISTSDKSQNAVRSTVKSTATPTSTPTSTSARQKENAKRAEKRKSDEAGDAKKRAEKIAAFEEKARRSEARQRELLANRIEKENQRKAKREKEAIGK